ncbi:MAG: hypothetical protein ACJAS4_001286 [Bacteriovoracaceae bacterium]|jgi:hypothetical protein
MKKLALMSLLVSFAQVSFAQVAQPSDQALDDDLNFKHSEEQEVRERNVASDKNLDEEQTDQDREVASDQDTQDSKIQYWKY